jgi:hypothetical protein
MGEGGCFSSSTGEDGDAFRLRERPAVVTQWRDRCSNTTQCGHVTDDSIPVADVSKNPDGHTEKKQRMLDHQVISGRIGSEGMFEEAVCVETYH